MRMTFFLLSFFLLLGCSGSSNPEGGAAFSATPASINHTAEPSPTDGSVGDSSTSHPSPGGSVELASVPDIASAPTALASKSDADQTAKLIVDGPQTAFEWTAIEHATKEFTVMVPEMWGPISPEALAAQSKAVSGPELQIDYIAGYQISAADPLTHPLILVRKLPARLMPKNRMKAAQNLFERSGDAVAREVERRTGQNLGLKAGVPVLEESSGIVWLKAEMKGLDGEQAEGLLAHHYVGDNIFQFIAGTTSSRASEDWPVLKRIISTVQFPKR